MAVSSPDFFPHQPPNGHPSPPLPVQSPKPGGFSKKQILWITIGLLVAFILPVTAGTLSDRSRSDHVASNAAATTTAPGCGSQGCFTAQAAQPGAVATTIAPTPSPTLSQTCADSAEWEREGGTELIDGYINNQGSGNINPDTLRTDCPQYLPLWERAKGGIGNGSSFAVPDEVKPGTYETTSSNIEGCYWERGRNGQIIANNFINASTVKQRVTIRVGDDTFVSKNCGNWIKVG